MLDIVVRPHTLDAVASNHLVLARTAPHARHPLAAVALVGGACGADPMAQVALPLPLVHRRAVLAPRLAPRAWLGLGLGLGLGFGFGLG